MFARRISLYAILSLTLGMEQASLPTACLAINSVESLPVCQKLAFGAGSTQPTTKADTSSARQNSAATDQLSPVTADEISAGNLRPLNKAPKSNMRGASPIELGPLELRDSVDATRSGNIKLVDSEKEQLADLWDATMANNQDIQFVVMRLIPARDPAHTHASLTKLLSTALYGAVTAGSVVLPQTANMSGAINRSGVQMIQQLLSATHSKDSAKTAMTESESIMLYNSVRSVADRLVDNFHEYKKYVNLKDMAEHDYADLKSIVSSSWADLSVKDQVEMVYFVNKSKREIEALDFDRRRCRQAIADLSGLEAVEKLDQQIDIELAKINNGTEVDSEAIERK